MESLNESELRRLVAQDRTDRAVEDILATHGARIFRMMVGVLGDEWVAEDAYQLFCIEVWKSLPSFRGDSSIYTWTYTIARRVCSRAKSRQREKEVRFQTGEQEQLVANWTRTVTAEWRKTESRNEFRRLCEGLETDERMLVMLRIDEEMTWKEIARVMEDDELDDAEISKASARFRKQFQRIKDDLASRMADASD